MALIDDLYSDLNTFKGNLAAAATEMESRKDEIITVQNSATGEDRDKVKDGMYMLYDVYHNLLENVDLIDKTMALLDEVRSG